MNARVDWRATLAALTPCFAARAAQLDEGDEFVAENYAELKAGGLYALGVPRELGGEGLELEEICELINAIARACSSTGLAFSMHTHLVAMNAWRWRHQKAPVAPLLEKVARDKALIITTGGGDWLDSSGEAVAADGGFRVNARKPFSSGAPAGDVLVSSAILGDEVIHFGIPVKTPGVRIEPTWKAMGMRSTASHDVVLENVLVPQAAVSARRPKGKWHPLYHAISMISFPIIYAVYLGVAEAARERALALVRKRRADEHLLQAVGEMENRLESARAAHAAWVQFSKGAQPGLPTTSKSMTYRTLVARGVLGTVDAAMEVAGGAGFFRVNGLERLFRDAQGVRFHPLQEGLQKALTARVALGMES